MSVASRPTGAASSPNAIRASSGSSATRPEAAAAPPAAAAVAAALQSAARPSSERLRLLRPGSSGRRRPSHASNTQGTPSALARPPQQTPACTSCRSQGGASTNARRPKSEHMSDFRRQWRQVQDTDTATPTPPCHAHQRRSRPAAWLVALRTRVSRRWTRRSKRCVGWCCASRRVF